MLPILRRSLDASMPDAHRIDFAAASILERAVLACLVRRQRPQRIFEIGTFRGVTALVMALNVPAGAELWTLDLPSDLSAADVAENYYPKGSGFHRMAAGAEGKAGAALRGYAGECEIIQLFGDVAAFDFTPYLDSIDLFFVDG